ncbi:acyltransferase family protein [Lacticaseibacillus kribbianus]|uniref:acyltransferase family protein n=1 Tax=Lacticaseibacillus kribbianus TaxID=2926292 RepID=UPI001CD3B654|nr:acyltransferase family protein [Lacticaseibacillus kribbianus]
MGQSKHRYIGGFDGLRTLGVIGVILYHLRPELFRGGYLGVLIFMTISGYLITDGFIRASDAGQGLTLPNFWARRARRLYPGLVAVLFGTGAYMVLFSRDLLLNFHKIVLTNLTFTYNWWQIFNGQSYFARFANNESPFVHLWTLSIEGQFYLLWPLLFLLLVKLVKKPERRFQVTLGIAVLSGLWMTILALVHPTGDPSRLYYGTDTRLFGLMLGAALAFIWPSTKLARHLNRRAAAALDLVGTAAVLAMVWGMLSLDADGRAAYLGGMFGFTVATVLLVAVVASPATIWGKLLSNPVFHWVGSRSYGIYLYQFPVMIFWENGFKNIADHPVLYPVLEVLLILGISELSYRFIEQPLAHYDYRKLAASVRALFDRSQALRRTRIVCGVAAVILALGTVGLVMAPGVKDTANDSAVAKKLRANQDDKAQHDKELAAARKRVAAAKKAAAAAKSSSAESAKSSSAKSSSAKSSSASSSAKAASSSTKSSSSASSTKPGVNADYVRYGISQDALTKAQGVTLTAVGDSVMLDAKPGLQKLMPKAFVDASVSRQLYKSVDIVKSYARTGALANVVVIGLGTNGSFTTTQMGEMMRAIGSTRQVFWINVHVPTRPWQNSVNGTLAGATKQYPNLTVIDWQRYCQGHRDWFYDDLVHPNPEGAKYYVAFVTREIMAHLKTPAAG